jgi:hypothetical protein
MIFLNQLKSLSFVNTQDGDEIIVSEIGKLSRYKQVVDNALKEKPYKYLFTEQMFDDETPKMGKAQLAAYNEAVGEIIINSNADVLVQPNLFDVVRNYYLTQPDNVWLSFLTHHLFFDAFTNSSQVGDFISQIQNDVAFQMVSYKKNDPPLFYLMGFNGQDLDYSVKQYFGSLKDHTMWDVGAPPITNIYAFPKSVLSKFDYSKVFAPFHIETVLIFLFEHYGLKPHIFADQTATFHFVDTRTQLAGYFNRFTQQAKTDNKSIEESLIKLVEDYPIEFKRILAFYVRKDNGPILNEYLDRPETKKWLKEFYDSNQFFREVSVVNHGFQEFTDMERFRGYVNGTS